MGAYIAFSNDIDCTTWDAYNEIRHVLFEELGVNIEDSFWLFDLDGTSDMALFGRDITHKSKHHDELLQKIFQGELTILHSAGNFSEGYHSVIAPDRGLILSGLEYLAKNAIVPKIWVNHGNKNNIQNIGGIRKTYHQGDAPSSECYILDILLSHGIEYFWNDLNYGNCDIFGNYNFVFTDSGGNNPLVSESITDSGYTIKTFNRYRFDNNKGGCKYAPTAQTLGWQLSEANLDKLVQSQGYCVIYQHFGATRSSDGTVSSAVSPIFSKESLEGMRRLRKYTDTGAINIIPLWECLKKADNRAK